MAVFSSHLRGAIDDLVQPLPLPADLFLACSQRRLYVRDTLGESVRILGKPLQPSE